MPNQAYSGIHGIPWGRCDRCGLDFPLSRLVRQRGILVCTERDCWDNPIAWNRERIIQDNLEGINQVEMVPFEIIKREYDDTVEEP